jgi:hypothetical protein
MNRRGYVSLVDARPSRKAPRQPHRTPEYREDRRFVARETRTVYVEAIDVFDPKIKRLPDEIAASLGSHGVMPHAIAEQEAEEHLRKIADDPDVDPSDTRRYMLQRLARARDQFRQIDDPLLLCAVTIAAATSTEREAKRRRRSARTRTGQEVDR